MSREYTRPELRKARSNIFKPQTLPPLRLEGKEIDQDHEKGQDKDKANMNPFKQFNLTNFVVRLTTNVKK